MSNSTFEFAHQMLTYLASNAAESVAFGKHWGKDFQWKNVVNGFNDVKERMTNETYAEILGLPAEQRLVLGFRYYNEATRNEGKMLIPLWLIEAMPSDFHIEVTSILGNICDIQEVDKDCRFGCIAYYI